MMSAEQIVDYVNARLETLANRNDSALDNLMRTDIDKETFDMYESIYNETFELCTELRRLLRVITYDSECAGDSE